jgi:hypothetical protein
MKILIISLPRTGSTSLMEKLSLDYKLSTVFEPWNGGGRQNYKSEDDNLVLKTIIFDRDIEFYVELTKEFDKIILLSRRDLDACSESYAYLIHHKGDEFNSRQQYEWKPTPNLDEKKEEMYFWNGVLIELGKRLEIPITYYEDIYDLNSYEKLRKEIKVDKLI